MIFTYKTPSNVDLEYFTAEEDVLNTLKNIKEYISKEIYLRGVDYNIHAIGVSEAYYDGTPCFSFEQGFWVVYSFEKGKRRGLSIFQSAWDAADYFLQRLS